MIRFLAVLVAALAPSLALAQAVTAPVLKVGNKFILQRTNVLVQGNPDAKSWDIHRTVTAVSSQGVMMDEFRGKNPEKFVLDLTPELNIRAINDRRFEPFYPELKFPLAAGDRWDSKVSFDRPGGGNIIYRLSHEAASEEIVVPAGTFRVIRIEVKGWYNATNGTGGSGAGQNKQTIWYAPDVGHIVQLHFQETDWKGQPYTEYRLALKSTNIIGVKVATGATTIPVPTR